MGVCIGCTKQLLDFGPPIEAKVHRFLSESVVVGTLLRIGDRCGCGVESRAFPLSYAPQSSEFFV